MNAHYEKIVDLWRAGKEEEAVRYFWECKKKELLSKEEIEKLEQFLPETEIMWEDYKKASRSAQEKIKSLIFGKN